MMLGWKLMFLPITYQKETFTLQAYQQMLLCRLCLYLEPLGAKQYQKLIKSKF